MKKLITIFTLILLSSLSAFADGGNPFAVTPIPYIKLEKKNLVLLEIIVIHSQYGIKNIKIG